MAHDKWKFTIKNPTVGGKGMHRIVSLAESHFGLGDQTGEPSNILTGFVKTMGGFGPGLTLGNFSAQLCSGI